jgi:hypothetical protein
MLDKKYYKYKKASNALKSENLEFKFICTGTNLKKEHSFNVDGAPFVFQSVIDYDSLIPANAVKSYLIDSINVIRSPIMLVAFVISLLSKAFRVTLLKSVARTSHRIIGDVVLKNKHLDSFSRELGLFTLVFIESLFGKCDEAIKVSEMVSFVFNNDDSYRIRAKDLFSEINQLDIQKKPLRELSRVFNIVISRDTKGVSDKFKLVKILLCAVLLIPNIRKSFKQAISVVDFNNVVATQEDFYWSFVKKDYDFGGFKWEDRIKFIKDSGLTFPTGIKL